MPTVYLSPDPINSTQLIPGGVIPAAGGKLFHYLAGSSTKTDVYTDITGLVKWANPIVLDSGGNLGGSNEVWIPAGVTVKFVLAPFNDTDPPIAPYKTWDNMSGINDATSILTEWIPGPAPTFVSATSFTLVGDQTAIFTPGRRVKTTNTAGTRYGTISTSVFGAVTTVTITNDSGTLDAGLSAVWYGILSVNHDSIPNVVSVMRFGAVGDGVTDDTAAFAAVALIGGRIYLPKPSVSYLITDTVLFAAQRTNIYGDGQQSTIIKFAPTTTGKTAFHFKFAAASTIAQCSLRGVAFDATGNTQGTKSAVRVTDGEEIIIDDVAVSNWTSAAKDCIGLQLRGRQTHSISNVIVFADNPISIEDNPNSTIDIDHYHFWNCYLCSESNSNPIVKIATGVNLSNVTFDGYQAWVLGTDGLRWVDTTSVTIGNNLRIANVRWEQSTTGTANMVRIEHNTNLQGFYMENCYGGLNTLGIKLRKVEQASLRNVNILTASGNALDVDSTVQPLILDNFFAQSGSTISVGTLVKVYSSGTSTFGGVSDFFVIYALPSPLGAVHSDVPLMGSKVSIAQDAAAVIGVAADQSGILFVMTDEDASAIYALKGGSNGTAEISDWAGIFTVTKDSATSYNIYYEAPSYKIQNKRTGTHVVQWFLLGDSI